MTYMTPIFIHG